MRKPILASLVASVLLFALVPLMQIGPASRFHVMAQSSFPDPANEHACPSQTGAGGGAEAIPAFVGPGIDGFSPNQSLCLPQLAPVPTGLSPLAFIVQGLEPGDRVDSQGTIYVESIDGVPNPNGTLPFKYEGQPDNCGIFGLTGGGCVNNVGSPTNLGLAPGGGDADFAVNAPDPNNSAIPNLALTSLTLAPGVTATNSRNRGDTFFTPPNVSRPLPAPMSPRRSKSTTIPAPARARAIFTSPSWPPIAPRKTPLLDRSAASTLAFPQTPVWMRRLSHLQITKYLPVLLAPPERPTVATISFLRSPSTTSVTSTPSGQTTRASFSPLPLIWATLGHLRYASTRTERLASPTCSRGSPPMPTATSW